MPKKSRNKFAPMLAGKADLSKQRYPVLVSPKMDGIRALVIGGQVVSRKLEVFPNTAAQQFGGDLMNGIDGELIIGRPNDEQVRNTTSGILNRKTDEAPGLAFWVFDDFSIPTTSFSRRLMVVEAVRGPSVYIIPHKLIENERQLLALEEYYLDEGFEGLILRDPNGPYKHGRSTTDEGWMLKMKKFEDAEALVLRVNEEMKNTNVAKKDKLGHTKRSKAQTGMVGKGRAGELVVRGLNGRFKGIEFVVPLGAAGDMGKIWWWAVGKEKVEKGHELIVTYRYFPKGVKNRPLLTQYVGVREKWDG